MTHNRTKNLVIGSSALMMMGIMVSTMMIQRCHPFVIKTGPTVVGRRNSIHHHHRSMGLTGRQQQRQHHLLFMSSMPPPDDEDSLPDPEGADIAAALFAAAQAKGVSLDADDLMDDDDDDDDDDEDTVPYDQSVVPYDEDDEAEPNIPQGAINAFLGYDTGDVGDKLAGNVSLTDDQLYSEVKERVLDTAGGFVDMVRAADDNDDDDSEEEGTVKKPYVAPTTVPDSGLTAGEVILLVLEALKNNDNPTPNKGVEILFGYSSSGSQIKNEEGLTPAEYADFLKEAEYKILFDHADAVRTNIQTLNEA
jgi:hypothetical protein